MNLIRNWPWTFFMVLGVLAIQGGWTASAADSMAPGLSTPVKSPPEILVEGIVVLSEAPMADGRIRMEARAGVRIVGESTWENVTVSVRDEIAGVRVEVLTQELRFNGMLGPGASASPADSDPVVIAVPSEQAGAVRAAMLAGEAFRTTGSEMWIYVHPPRGIDADTERAWRYPAEWADAERTEIRLVFTNTTPFLLSLQPGDLLVENLSVHPLARTNIVSGTAPDDTLTTLADYVPFRVGSVTVEDDQIRVVGRRMLLLEVIRSATLVGTPLDAYVHPLRDPYKPDPEKTHTRREQSERHAEARLIATEENPRDGRLADLNGMFARPWHFNEVPIGGRVTLSGEWLFRQSGLRLELKIRDFRVERVLAQVDAGVVFNLLIECGEPGDDSEEASDGSSITLFEIDDIPAVTFNLGGVPVSVKPVLRLTAGVEANVPSRLVLPLQSAFTVGMEMGYDRSLVTDTTEGFFYRPITEFVPVRVSDPTVFDELAATVGFWTQLDVGLEIAAGSGIAIQAGPSLGIRLENDYRLAPIEDPWWAVDLGLELVGNFAIDLELLEFAEIRLVDSTASIHRFDLFHRDAGGPLTGGARLAAPVSTRPFGPRTGEGVRWGRLFQSRPNFQGFRNAFVFAVPDGGGDIIAGGYNAYSMLARFSPTGDLRWILDTHPVPTIHKATPLPDGSFFTAGTEGLNIVFARYDGHGNRLWATAYSQVPRFTIEAVTVGADDSGQPEYYVAGSVTHTTVTTSDPALIKLDAEGQPVWARYYSNPHDDEALGMTLAADGHILLCGFGRGDVPPPTTGSPEPGNILKLALAGGMVMKVDSQTGAVRWATVCPARWGMRFNAIVEAPDGTIYAAGASSRPVTLDRPSNVFARFSPQGALLDHVSVGDDPDWPDLLPYAGRSPYDAVHGLRWTPDGLIACGASGLGADVTGWVMGLTGNLGVRFYSVVDAPGSNPFLDLADAGDGFAVVGHTHSPFALAGQTGQTIPILLKLPWEGLMRFAPNTGFRSLFLQPWVYHASATHEYQVLSSFNLPPSPVFPDGRKVYVGNHHGPLAYTPQELALTSQPAGTAPNAGPNPTRFPVEFVPLPEIHAYETWAAYHHLPEGSSPEGDSDGDGLSDRFEAYFGRDPKIPESTPIFAVTLAESEGSIAAIISFTRAPYARSWGVEIQASDDLLTWAPVSGLGETVVALDPATERVEIRVPADVLAHRFFRAAAR
ncbi:MAG: hypothetical protein KF833_13560 [Verrucomicrobiae bacterium]|nr:hypothetical protein [Verrucomicrobiae bacterium]